MLLYIAMQLTFAGALAEKATCTPAVTKRVHVRQRKLKCRHI